MSYLNYPLYWAVLVLTLAFLAPVSKTFSEKVKKTNNPPDAYLVDVVKHLNI